MTNPEATLASALSALSAQYLTFSLGAETFGMGIRGIKEIIEYRDQTEVPMMPASVRGVINLRGAVVPVVDLSVRFGKAASAVGKRSCIVIVEAGDGGGQAHTIGVLVDAVSEVMDIAGADIEAAPSFGSHIGREFIAGIGKVRGKFVILLDVERALSLDEIGALCQDGSQRVPTAELVD